jgi:hypothetical protein
MTRGSGRRGRGGSRGSGRRTKKITRPDNQAAAVIFGVRENGDIARVTAYQLKDGVRLSGPNGSCTRNLKPKAPNESAS